MFEKKQLRKLRSLVANTQSPEAGLAAKQASAKALRAAHAKFAKIAGMNMALDAGGDAASGVAKAKRKMNDTWTKRVSNNVKGFYDPKKARAQHA